MRKERQTSEEAQSIYYKFRIQTILLKISSALKLNTLRNLKKTKSNKGPKLAKIGSPQAYRVSKSRHQVTNMKTLKETFLRAKDVVQEGAQAHFSSLDRFKKVIENLLRNSVKPFSQILWSELLITPQIKDNLKSNNK